MPLNAFTKYLGITQGRVGAADAPSGDFEMVVGSLLPGIFEDLYAGAIIVVRQADKEFLGAKILRMRLRIRPPAATPAGIAWKASLLVDDVEKASRTFRAGAEHEYVDMAANVAKYATGVHTIDLALQLVTFP